MKMQDMKRSKKERKTESSPMKYDGEDYPYGLSVRLDHHSLKKLGMHEKLPKVGDKIKMHAHAHVTSVSQHNREGGNPDTHVELQLRHMAVEPGAGTKDEKDGDTEESMNKGMKHAVDKAVVGPKEEGSEDEDGEEA
jgi:hypothetical protein